MPLTFLPNAIIPTLSKENKSLRSLKQRISRNLFSFIRGDLSRVPVVKARRLQSRSCR